MEHIRFDLAAGPWWVYILLVLVAATLAVVTYARTNPPLTPLSKGLLIALRTFGLACLLLVLFEPLLRFVRSETSTPRVAIALDVSASMAISDRAGDRAQQARSALDQLHNGLGEGTEVFFFDESLREAGSVPVDSIRFSGFRTNIAHAINSISNRSLDDRFGAIILVTDGNHNAEDVPVHVAERSGMGIYSVGIGDTVPPRDIHAASILVNGIAVVGEPLPITVEIVQSNMEDRDVDVIFEDNAVEIGRERIALRRSIGKQSITFIWTPKTDGIRKISARIVPVQGEFTEKNNVVQDFVTVRKDKRRVLIVAGAPSPDVTFVKAALAHDPSVTIQTYIQKQGSEFYEGALPANALDDVEAVVMIGFPTQSSPRDVVERIATACAKGRSLMFIPSLQTDYTKLGSFEKVLPFRVGGSRPQEFLVTPDVTRGASSDPIIKLNGTEADMAVWNNLPPIYRTETFVEPAPGAVTLATIRVGNAPLDEPLLMKREDGNIRSLALLGYGIYRWKLLGDGPATSRGGAVTDVLQTFMGNSLKWLSVRDDARRVRIKSTHPFYAAGERVGFIASIQDQTFAAIDDAEVKIVVEGASGRRDVILTGQGNGRYAFDIGSLAPGDYSYTGTAVSRGVQIGTDKGRFTVGDLGIEAGASTRNISLLQTLAVRTGSLATSATEIEKLIAAVKADPRLRPVARTHEREFPLYHLPWLMFAGILGFSLEWFIRKRRGLV
ncbi:MAG: VWA domain-containing protein [Ignavibacteria bacterium]|nr:VWA domain-containing protein [Ignavibacteria bacterium]